jgi:FlaA1/EpsC-like NDP-sugar epimerase
MTIPEASQLVLQAGAMARGGEVFVLDMGEPIKIVDLACHLIELTGLVPHKDIKIEYTGLRPGEKLFEELLTAEEGSSATKHEKIFITNLKKVDEEKLLESLNILKNLEDPDKIVNILAKLVPAYQGSRVRRLRLIEGKDCATSAEGKMVPEDAL